MSEMMKLEEEVLALLLTEAKRALQSHKADEAMTLLSAYAGLRPSQWAGSALALNSDDSKETP